MDQAFIDACNFVIPFGKFKGQRIAQVGQSDEGLKYLDWLNRGGWGIGRPGPFEWALRRYLKDPAAGARVEATIEY